MKYVLTGSNYSTECCREPEEWGAYPGIDKTLIMDIHSRFGQRELKSFPVVDIFLYKIIYQKFFGMEIVQPLNFIKFIKEEAESELEKLFGWQKFKHKHHESRFTRFYEDFWAPKKFGFEKRRAHLSSLIMTGQITRKDALERIDRSEMDDGFHRREFEYVANKLGLSRLELEDLLNGSKKSYRNYKNKRWLIGLGSKALRAVGLERRLFR